MANDYNAKLIAELYTATTVERATKITDEMLGIKDSIFPVQIYEAYKKFKGTNMDHYFISDLAQFQTAEADEILKKHAVETESEADIYMLLKRMLTISFFDPILIQKVSKYLSKELQKEDKDSYDIEEYCSYLKEAGELHEFEPLLQSIFEEEKTDAGTKKSILKILLGMNSKKYLKYYLTNYSIIKGTRTEIVFATEISTWKNGIIDQLHQFIIETGTATAKEIIEKKMAQNKVIAQAEEAVVQQIVQENFSNSEVTTQIIQLRSNINLKAETRFGHKVFKQSEKLILQASTSRVRGDFIENMMNLRDIIKDFDERITNTPYTLKEMQVHIPTIENTDGSFNKFIVYLMEHKILIDEFLVSYSDLNKLLNKVAHPNQISGLVTILKKLSIFESYESENWPKLHNLVLNLYRDILVKLDKPLNQTETP